MEMAISTLLCDPLGHDRITPTIATMERTKKMMEKSSSISIAYAINRLFASHKHQQSLIFCENSPKQVKWNKKVRGQMCS